MHRSLRHSIVNVIFFLCWTLNQQAAMTLQSSNDTHDSKRPIIDSVTNNLNHTIYMVFPQASSSPISLQPGQKVNLKNIPSNSYKAATGVIDGKGLFYSDISPIIRLITPQHQNFIVFVGELFSHDIDIPLKGVWLMRIHDIAYHDYAGFTCTVDHKEIISAGIPETSFDISSEWRKIPPYKQKIEWVENINLTPHLPEYDLKRRASSPLHNFAHTTVSDINRPSSAKI